MTTLERNNLSFNTLIIIAIAAAIAVFAAIAVVGNLVFTATLSTQAAIGTVAETHIVEVVSNHAAQRHGTKASDAMKCLKDYGSSMSFVDKDGLNTWVCLNLKNSKWYAVVTSRFIRNGGYKVSQLVTAYEIIGNIDDYVKLMAVQGRTVIGYAIMAGDTYFSVP